MDASKDPGTQIDELEAIRFELVVAQTDLRCPCGEELPIGSPILVPINPRTSDLGPSPGPTRCVPCGSRELRQAVALGDELRKFARPHRRRSLRLALNRLRAV